MRWSCVRALSRARYGASVRRRGGVLCVGTRGDDVGCGVARGFAVAAVRTARLASQIQSYSSQVAAWPRVRDLS